LKIEQVQKEQISQITSAIVAFLREENEIQEKRMEVRMENCGG